MKIGVVGTGQFAGSSISLWQLHPDVKAIYASDLDLDPALVHSFRIRAAKLHDRSRLPQEFEAAHKGGTGDTPFPCQ